MTASARILDHFSKANGSEPIRILGASGQLGYGVPTPAFSAGLERRPHLIGCDMGSIDIGPYYLGSGELATALAATRRDLRKVLLGALKLKIPLIIGSAGSASAKPHLEKTLAIIREIAREEGLSFRMGVLRAAIGTFIKRGAFHYGFYRGAYRCGRNAAHYCARGKRGNHGHYAQSQCVSDKVSSLFALRPPGTLQL
jgi:hypothetical protein